MLERLWLTALIPVLTALCASAMCADNAYVGAQVCAPAIRLNSRDNRPAATPWLCVGRRSILWRPGLLPPRRSSGRLTSVFGLGARRKGSTYRPTIPNTLRNCRSIGLWSRHARGDFRRQSQRRTLHRALFFVLLDSQSFDITPQHEGLPAKTLHGAMGQAFKIQGPGLTVQGCFQCHSTGPVSVSPNQESKSPNPACAAKSVTDPAMPMCWRSAAAI